MWRGSLLALYCSRNGLDLVSGALEDFDGEPEGLDDDEDD